MIAKSEDNGQRSAELMSYIGKETCSCTIHVPEYFVAPGTLHIGIKRAISKRQAILTIFLKRI